MIIIIEDQIHCEHVATCATFDEAVAELKRLASIQWDQPPNRTPCASWQTCGREYELREYDDAQTPWKLLRRLPALAISRNEVKWTNDLEMKCRSAERVYE